MMKRIKSPMVNIGRFKMLILSLFLFASIFAEATHFRYGSISWRQVSGNTYEFKVTQGWRRTFPQFNLPNVGSIVPTPYNLEFGDGTRAPINLKVSTVNIAEDWFFGEAIIVHTYATAGDREAFFAQCCRIDGLQNVNIQENFRVSTRVNVGSNNDSPVTSVPPIVNVQVNTIQKFFVPFSDPDGDALTYRFATAAEMDAPSYHIPTGTTINTLTGEVTMNTNGFVLNSLYAIGVIASDGRSSVKADFIVKVVPQSTPPQFDYSVTPIDGNTFQIKPGQALSFPVKAFDIDLGSTVKLSAVGVPNGAVFAPGLPVTSNPVSTIFNWTPTGTQFGTYVLNFIAEDNLGVQAFSSVTITVSLKPVFDVPPTPAFADVFGVKPGDLLTFPVQASDPDPLDVVKIVNVTKPATAVFSPLPTTASNPTNGTFSWTPVVSEWGDHVLEFEAKDSYDESTIHKIGVIVNTPPVFTSTPVTQVVVNNLYTYPIVGLDPDIAYGDELELFANVLPSWLTFIDNGNGTGVLTGTPGIGDVGTHNIRLILEDVFHHALPNGVAEQVYTVEVLPCNISMGTPQVTNVSCFGQTNGAIEPKVLGGYLPITYTWSTGATDPTLIGLGNGTYTLTVKDKANCEVTTSIEVTQPERLIARIDGQSNYLGFNVSCFGSSDGSALAGAQGGTAPYSFAWSNGTSLSTASNLSAGIYSVLVTDGNGCTDSASITLVQPSKLEASPNVNNVTCSGQNNGSIDPQISGGIASYSYTWSIGATSATLSNISGGVYSVNVADANGCLLPVTMTVSEPSQLTTSLLEVSNFNGSSVSCFGATDGFAKVSGNGGIAPYTYVWSSGDNTALATNLAAGTYNVTVTDKNNCSSSLTINLTQPTKITANPLVTNVTCFSQSNGSVDPQISGGTSPYLYAWSGGVSSAVLSNISGGVYSVNVSDANGCLLPISMTVSEPTQLTSSVAGMSNFNGSSVSCFASTDGFATVAGNGGTSPYTYEWSNGAATATVSNLGSGTYNVLVKDANNCLSSLSITLTQPTKITFSPVVTNVTCFGQANGSINPNVAGGTNPYSYVWSNGAVSATLNAITSGTYSLTVTDLNGCTASSSSVVTQPTKLVPSILSVSSFNGFNVKCFGASNGSATAGATGATSPYTYSWSNGAATATASNLTAGTYIVTVKDANNCTESATVTLSQPAKITTTVSSPKVIGAYNTSCTLDGDGSASAAVSGGISPYTLSWNNGKVGNSIAGLLAGTYTVTVTDKNACIATGSVTLVRPENCKCVTTPILPTVSCPSSKILDGLSNVVLNTNDNASIVNSYTGNININGGNLTICGNANLQSLSIPRNSTVIVLGTLTVGSLNLNDASARLENYGTIIVTGGFAIGGKVVNNKSITVSQQANVNSSGSLINNGTLNVASDFNNDNYFENNSLLVSGNAVYNNSNSTTLNNCSIKSKSFYVNSNVRFENNGTVNVTTETRFNSTVPKIASGSILTTKDGYFNGSALSSTGLSCALIKVASYTQINQATLKGLISLCDVNGFEINNNLVLQNGANSNCNTCAYTGSTASLREESEDVAKGNISEVNTFLILPNPVENNQFITVRSSNEIVEVTIYDNTGKLVKSTSSSVIELNQLERGIYFVKVLDNLGNTNQTKLLVQ